MARRFAPLFGLLMLIGGCASPNWQSTKPHLTVSVVSMVNPIAMQRRLGVTVFGNKIGPVDMGFDLNGEVDSVVRENLGRFGRYTVVDIPVDAKALFAAAKSLDKGWMVSSLPRPIADKLVETAKGRGVDFIVVVTDVWTDSGWGLYQYHSPAGCIDPYFSYVVFFVDANTGDTAAMEVHTGFKRIENGIAWDEDWSTIPDAQRQVVFDDLKAIVSDDIPRTMTRMGIIPNSNYAKYPDPYVCEPKSGGK